MNRNIWVWIMALSLAGNVALAEPAAPLSALAKLPVREITVFKDGHAFVLHSGKMPTDAVGNVLMDYLPTPVIGTFWPYSAEKRAKLSAVTASPRKVLVERTALTLRELIEANVGADVFVTENTAANRYRATILQIPDQHGEELEATSPPNSGQKLPVKGNVVLLKLQDGGVKVIALDRILDVTFTGEHKEKVAQEEFRNLLTLKLDWDGRPQKEAEVGLLYLQRGVRWIPNYKVAIDGKGTAVVKLQATLINELADLDDVTTHLVIGVPTFAFKETVDPMSLQQALAQLSQYFQPDARTANGFANSIMSQRGLASGGFGQRSEPTEGRTMDLGPEVATAGKAEDLFMFSVKHVTLKKGQRMVVPVTEFTLKYQDVYALDIPFTPPAEVWRNQNNGQQAELARLFNSPKVMHKIRLTNRSEYPLTTAPALILRDDRVIAQGLMTYASPGADTDLDVTTAIDVRVKKTDNETKRTPNAEKWQGNQYGRVDLEGKITLTSFAKQPVEVEVTRSVLGNASEADHDAKIEMVNIFEDQAFGSGGPTPYWWGWFNWPWWWHHFNGVGRIRWTVKLEPGKPADLAYLWNYYWQ
ncbi:MAG: hypothetical protein WCG79_12590 [Verrucomicrobiota bacterium]|jgi:hypothetical protein